MFARSVVLSARSVVRVPARLSSLRVPALRMQHVIAMAAAAEGKKLYVGNLAWGASRDDLYNLFSQYGDVSDAFIPTDRDTGRPRGFAFVTFADPDNADAAVAELNGQEFQGRELKVNEAQPQSPRQGGGGRGGFRSGGRGGGGYRSGGRGGGNYNYDSY